MNDTKSEPARNRPTTELGRVLAHCHQRLRAAAPVGTSPLLRLQRGAGLIQGPRAQQVLDLLEPLLTLAASKFYVPEAQSMVAGVTIRPKVRVLLRVGGAGLLAECRYFGEPPTDGELRALYATPPALSSAAVAGGACGYALAASSKDGIVVPAVEGAPALPPSVSALAARPDDLARGEICLRSVAHEPPRRWPVVRVMAGRREVAVPMFSVEQAVLEEQLSGKPPLTHSLATCFGEESSATSKGRPALLILRRGNPKIALRVEALIGHGNELVYPVSSLLQGTPWVLGVIEGDGSGPPVLVVEPAALIPV